MRIPLDYYRILGIPIQVTDEQLRQAYHDRSLQLPRREYSEGAIAARKQLLYEAYQVLSDADQKKKYDDEFLEKTYTVEPPSEPDPHLPGTGEAQQSFLENHSPWLEIEPQQWVGGLLILQELGEYELVIRLGKTYLKDSQENQTPPAFREDIILTIALAYLELSREQWQQREYETAADSGNKGLELLTKEQLFSNLQQEIETDLSKLRPYRILELLALPLTSVQKRTKGLQLLQEMLQQRHGIDGKGEDYSGLNLDDFLRFIQQLRLYLTVEEQQNLFEVEAQRPSAVASYLQVYTHIAQGFADKKPVYILEALKTLQQLGQRQDVYLEQAICYLLLGQTEEAIFALEQSQDTATLKFIQEQSQGEPDLLPGLCLYGERWLQTEVFSHFRDLINQQASLKKYFANEEVQNYLEQLSFESQAENQVLENNFDLISEKSSPISTQSPQLGWTREPNQSLREPFSTPSQTTAEVYQTPQTTTASLFQPQSSSSAKANPRKGYGETLREYTQGNVALSADYEETPPSRSSYRRRRRPLAAVEPVVEPPVVESEEEPTVVRPSLRRRRTKFKKNKKLDKQRLVVAITLLLGLGIGGLLLKLLPSSRVAGLEGDYLAIGLHHSPLDIPAADAHVIVAGPLTEQNAQQVLQEWLYSKSMAFGKKHQIDRLTAILADPMLSLWKNRALALQKNQNYYQYQHQVQLRSVNLNPQNPDQAIVEAQVNEKARFFDRQGKLNQARSYDDNLLVRYELIRQRNQWKIQESEVIN